MNLAAGAESGPYHLVGEVWRATYALSGETVALRVFSGRFDQEGKERLRADLEELAANAIGDQRPWP